jgi:hypothetical protein
MKVKLALRTDIIGQVEDVEYDDVFDYELSGSFLLLVFPNGREKVFPVHRVFFVGVEA